MLIVILVIVLRTSLSLMGTRLIVATRNMCPFAIESKLFYSYKTKYVSEFTREIS
jgi:hypothetical protein